MRKEPQSGSFFFLEILEYNEVNMDNYGKAWVVAVNMGYGHQRTAEPLKDIAPRGKVINANDYPGIPKKDRKIWETARRFYEAVSKFKKIPLVGEGVFSFYDKFQKIPSFYPRRDLSRPTFGLKKIFSLIKRGWGRDLISKLKQNSLPLITTFFTPAFMAEFFDYPGEIFCVICDADISRSWVSLEPKKSRIKYFAPNSWTVNRLELYGVKEENIFLTGYPLPGIDLRDALKNRLLNLDPKKEYFSKYRILIKEILGELPEKSNHILTIMFSIGGAGAQKEIGLKIIEALKNKIANREIKIILAVGIRKDVKYYFEKKVKGAEVIFNDNINDYFTRFNQKLKTTDILWTKPSELSFYCGLGLPIIMTPSLGSQEDFNRKWLLSLGAGVDQENPKYAAHWLFDYLESGRLAEAAMQGFIEAEKSGTYNIKEIISLR